MSVRKVAAQVLGEFGPEVGSSIASQMRKPRRRKTLRLRP